MENYVIHGKLRDSCGPCRDYVGILICFVKNYVIH
jgi:thiol-disulfide isomerase/thioredoxin